MHKSGRELDDTGGQRAGWHQSSRGEKLIWNDGYSTKCCRNAVASDNRLEGNAGIRASVVRCEHCAKCAAQLLCPWLDPQAFQLLIQRVCCLPLNALGIALRN